MAKLVAFFACEKVIFEKQHETPTIVAVVQRVVFQADMPEPIPKDALAPMPWQIFTMWMHDPDEKDKEFVQKSEVTFPDGSPAIFQASLPFKGTDLYSTNAVRLVGFPIGHDLVQVKMWLESEKGEKIFPEVFYSVQVQKLAKDHAV